MCHPPNDMELSKLSINLVLLSGGHPVFLPTMIDKYKGLGPDSMLYI
jgi:hypothetical protein